jgi:murein DD-endopeptidase MepM/ murein hydrolase activator NlpD
MTRRIPWLLTLAACASEPVPDRMELQVAPDLVLFDTVVGDCDTEILVVRNAGTVETNVRLSAPIGACADAPFRTAAAGVGTSPGGETRFELQFCPGVAGSCEGELRVLYDSTLGTDEQVISLQGGARSPDDDGDDYALAEDDCDDDDPGVHPGATETPDGVDEDCDGLIDEGTSAYDDDGDGFSELDGDCDDADPARRPGLPELLNQIDEDCDGLVDDTTRAYDDDGDGFSDDAGDCNDGHTGIYPGAAELPDYIDQDCNGATDDGTELYDDDGDGLSEEAGDCDDAAPTIYPGAPERPNGVDDDCNVLIDDTTQLYDDDGDGLAEAQGDCNDDDATIRPGVSEVADGRDNDCDGIVDDGTVLHDDDGDGLSDQAGDCNDANPSIYAGAPEQPDGLDNDCDGTVDEDTVRRDDDGDGFTEQQGDCDDTTSTIAPGRSEEPNGRDDDCDGTVDEGTTIYDNDGDGLSAAAGDCNDANLTVYPGALELPDGVDNNCNGTIDEGTIRYDDDGDGQTEQEGDCNDYRAAVFAGAPERENGLDDDCDGLTDEGTALYDDDGDGQSEAQGDCNDANVNVFSGALELPDALDNDCDDDVDENDYGGVTSPITQQGGTLELPDGTRLFIPAGAVSSPQVISLNPLPPNARYAPVQDGGTLLGGARMLPEGLRLAMPAHLELPLWQPGLAGQPLRPAVFDHHRQIWITDTLDDGSSLATVDFDGRGLVLLDHFSDHGVILSARPITDADALLTLDRTAYEVQAFEQDGIRQFAPPTISVYRMQRGLLHPWYSRGWDDAAWREARYEEAFTDLVLRHGIEDTKDLGNLFSGVMSKSDLFSHLASGGTTITGSIADYDLVHKLDVFAQGPGPVQLDLFRAGRAARITAAIHKASLAASYGSALLEIQAPTVQLLLATYLGQVIEQERLDYIEALVASSSLNADPAVGAAWNNVREVTERRHHDANAAVEQAFRTTSGSLERTALHGRLAGLIPKAVLDVASFGAVGGYLLDEVLLDDTTEIWVDNFQAHKSAGQLTAITSLWITAFLTQESDNPAIEAERGLSSAYLGYRFGELMALRMQAPEDSEDLHKAALGLTEWFRPGNHARRAAMESFYTSAAARHEAVYRLRLAQLDAPDEVQEAWRGSQLIADSATHGFTRGEDPWMDYWNQDFDPRWFGGEVWYNLNNHFLSSEGVQNWGTWELTVPTDGTWAVDVRIPSNHATAMACYEVWVGDLVSYWTVDQRQYFDAWVSLGHHAAAAQSAVRVVLRDRTTDPHLSAEIGFDALRITEAFDAAASARQVEGCDFDVPFLSRRPAGPLMHPAGHDGVAEAWASPWYRSLAFLELNPNFGYKAHMGEDWSIPGDADIGEPIYAVGAGEVVDTRVGRWDAWNGVVTLRLFSGAGGFLLPDGSTTTDVWVQVGHLHPDQLFVSVGDQVEAGDVIGVVGPTPDWSSGPHIHVEVFTGGAALSGVGYDWPGVTHGRIPLSDFLTLNGAP